LSSPWELPIGTFFEDTINRINVQLAIVKWAVAQISRSCVRHTIDEDDVSIYITPEMLVDMSADRRVGRIVLPDLRVNIIPLTSYLSTEIAFERSEMFSFLINFTITPVMLMHMRKH
jgi:hypothetical protein